MSDFIAAFTYHIFSGTQSVRPPARGGCGNGGLKYSNTSYAGYMTSSAE
jgi:hypothetical protein